MSYLKGAGKKTAPYKRNDSLTVLIYLIMSGFYNKKNRIIQAAKEQMTDTLKLPRELVTGDSVITMQGREEVFVENYRGILECCDTVIWISTRNFRLCIEGRNLCVAYYTNDEMKVTGTIEHISFME